MEEQKLELQNIDFSVEDVEEDSQVVPYANEKPDLCAGCCCFRIPCK